MKKIIIYIGIFVFAGLLVIQCAACRTLGVTKTNYLGMTRKEVIEKQGELKTLCEEDYVVTPCGLTGIRIASNGNDFMGTSRYWYLLYDETKTRIIAQTVYEYGDGFPFPFLYFSYEDLLHCTFVLDKKYSTKEIERIKAFAAENGPGMYFIKEGDEELLKFIER